jgi:hypothetical protein
MNQRNVVVNHELQKQSSTVNLAELAEMFGPPPVLRTENVKAYEEMLDRLMQCHAPRDFMEQSLIKHLADSTWEIKRYTRHKTLAIERKFGQLREHAAKRAKALEQHQGAWTGQPPESDGTPATELVRMYALEDIVDSTVDAVDAILLKPPAELGYNHALEVAIAYHGELDKLLNAAVARRNDVLEQLDWYRHGLGKRMREASDQIIDAEFKDAELEPKDVAPPLAPSIEEAK